MTTNNLQLQALIAEQKALTAKFEELLSSSVQTLSEVIMVAEDLDNSTVDEILSRIEYRLKMYDLYEDLEIVENETYFDVKIKFSGWNGEGFYQYYGKYFDEIIGDYLSEYYWAGGIQHIYIKKQLNLTDPKKVYIKGHPTPGAEVIKMLEDLGGVNKFNWDGTRSYIIYRIRHEDNVILSTAIEDLRYTPCNIELHLPEEVSAENAQTTDIKVGDWIWVDVIRGYGAKIQNEVYDNNPHRITYIDSRHIAINLNGAPMAIFNSDKFHKVDPPTKEVELIEGEVYCCGDLDSPSSFIFVFDEKDEEGGVFSKFQIRIYDSTLTPYKEYLTSVERTKLATPEQRKQLFDALEKAGKHFDKENMRLLDVEEWSKEHRDYPVICRHDNNVSWSVKLMCDYVKGKALVRTKSAQKQWMSQAIPYNDQTKYLIGTTNSPDKLYKFVSE